ncbi:hypothetical protein Tco_0924711 [Tanacetum coccineum]|uniref:PB1-like domain-containing protein n=1 Tax=Tanacetum coccineum TaxID=301880 RepID=A0ABQ5D7G0_9ASTR
MVVCNFPNYFSLKIHHGGYLSDSPNRKYKDGIFNYFDEVNVDLFSIVDLNDMLEMIALRNDQDVLNLINHITKYKLIVIYYVHEYTDLEVVIEEKTTKKSNRDLVKKRTPIKNNMLPLLHKGDESEANTPILDNVGNDETIIENYVEMENDEDIDIAKDIYSDMEVSNESEDSEWIDEEHIMNEVEVDMKDFYEHTDKEVEWIGCNKGNNEIHVKHIVGESYDLNDFISASDSDTELEDRRKKALRKLRKEHEKRGSVDNTTPFYMGKNFPDKETISKGKDGETLSVRTLKDDHDCLQTRTVNILKNSFLIKDIEETIKPNPYVLIRALKD